MEMKIHDYRKLVVWQKSIDLVVKIYRIVKELPEEEKYALSDQLRRASISIPSNIAEGYGRIYNKELLHFLTISRGSLYEVETQLIIGKELGFFTDSKIEPALLLITEISKMLATLIKKLKNDKS